MDDRQYFYVEISLYEEGDHSCIRNEDASNQIAVEKVPMIDSSNPVYTKNPVG
jgi:hypothetical protein